MRQFDYSYLADRTWDNEIMSYISKIHEYKGNRISSELYKADESNAWLLLGAFFVEEINRLCYIFNVIFNVIFSFCRGSIEGRIKVNINSINVNKYPISQILDPDSKLIFEIPKYQKEAGKLRE